jgi:hypothetical protein
MDCVAWKARCVHTTCDFRCCCNALSFGNSLSHGSQCSVAATVTAVVAATAEAAHYADSHLHVGLPTADNNVTEEDSLQLHRHPTTRHHGVTWTERRWHQRQHHRPLTVCHRRLCTVRPSVVPCVCMWASVRERSSVGQCMMHC